LKKIYYYLKTSKACIKLPTLSLEGTKMKKLLCFVILGLWNVPVFAQTIKTNHVSIPFAPSVSYATGSGQSLVNNDELL
jgi:hypothetical protein